MTKEGTLAGPRQLEAHNWTPMLCEGEHQRLTRILRAVRAAFWLNQ